MSEVRESRFVAGWDLETVLRAGFTVVADPALMTGNTAGLTAVNVLIILSTHRVSAISLSFTLSQPHSIPPILIPSLILGFSRWGGEKIFVVVVIVLIILSLQCKLAIFYIYPTPSLST